MATKYRKGSFSITHVLTPFLIVPISFVVFTTLSVILRLSVFDCSIYGIAAMGCSFGVVGILGWGTFISSVLLYIYARQKKPTLFKYFSIAAVGLGVYLAIGLYAPFL